VRQSPSGTKLAIADAVARWLAICEKIGRDGRETVEPETLKEYQRRANVMKEYEWPKQVHELEPTDVVQFRSWLLENKTRDLARRTLSSFHSVLIEMKLQGYLQDDPAAGITIRSGGRYEDEDSEVEIPSDHEVRDILVATEALRTKNDYMAKCWARYKPMIHLAVFSGMRPSEYRGLPWANVGDGVIYVKQRADKTGLIGPVKSKAGRRTLHISRQITDMIFEWRDLCPKSDNDLVFPTDSGKPISLSNFAASAWTPLMREAGLVIPDKTNGEMILKPKYSPYCLRHYQASKLIEKSKDAKYIQTFMGHSDIKITYNTYGHLMKDRDDRHRQTAEEIAADLLG
jgi:integrase